MTFETDSSNAFTSWYIVMLLNSAGISINTDNPSLRLRLLTFYHILSFFALLIGVVFVLLKESKTMNQAVVTSTYIISGIFFNTSTFVLHRHKKNMFDILHFVDNELPTIMNENRHIRKSNEKFRKFFFTYGIIFYIVYTFTCMAPFIFYPISGNQLGDTNTLLLPSRFPWKIDSLLKYILTIGLQFSWLFPLSIPVVLNSTFYVYFIIEVRIQYDILCENISKLKDYSNSLCQQDDETIRTCFRSCIQHHQTIVKLIRNFCSCYNWVFRVVLVYSLANLSLALFGVASGERTVSAMTQQMSSFVVSFIYLYIYCFTGEMLENLNERLRLCLYDIKWFERSIKFRRNFTIFATVIHRSVNLRASRDTVASYDLFFKVVKLAYSYFNILISTFSH